jgi:hypothetical protein
MCVTRSLVRRGDAAAVWGLKVVVIASPSFASSRQDLAPAGGEAVRGFDTYQPCSSAFHNSITAAATSACMSAVGSGYIGSESCSAAACFAYGNSPALQPR